MKKFLKIHFAMQIPYAAFVLMVIYAWGASLTSSENLPYMLMFVLFGSHIQVLPFSGGLFLLLEFIKSKYSIKIEKKNE